MSINARMNIGQSPGASPSTVQEVARSTNGSTHSAGSTRATAEPTSQQRDRRLASSGISASSETARSAALTAAVDIADDTEGVDQIPYRPHHPHRSVAVAVRQRPPRPIGGVADPEPAAERDIAAPCTHDDVGQVQRIGSSRGPNVGDQLGDLGRGRIAVYVHRVIQA